MPIAQLIYILVGSFVNTQVDAISSLFMSYEHTQLVFLACKLLMGEPAHQFLAMSKPQLRRSRPAVVKKHAIV